VVDHEAADRHFGADVEKDAQHAEQHVRVAQHLGEAVAVMVVLVGGLGQGGQAEQPDECREQEQHHRQADVGPLHGVRLLRLVRQLIGRGQRGQFGRILHHVGEDQQSAEPWRQEGAERIQRLRQGQPAGAGLLRPEQGHVRVGGHLQHGDAGGQHEQRAQEGGIQMQRRGGPETQCTYAGNRQAGHDAFLVTERRHQPAGRHAHQEVGAEKGELHQHHFGVVELEARLQMRNQDVVEAGQEAPHEEDRGEHAQRQRVAGVGLTGQVVIRHGSRGARRRSGKCHGGFPVRETAVVDGAGSGWRSSNRANVTVFTGAPITRCNMSVRGATFGACRKTDEVAMSRHTTMLLTLLACVACTPVLASGGHAADVDPRIGTGGDGHTFPGATVPFGMIQLSPDTAMPDFKHAYKWAAGYQYGDPTIMGFSHTHFSGSGHSDLGDVLVMPIAGDVRLDPGDSSRPDSGYRSRFSHASEVVQAGYYAVTLSDYGVRAELTAGRRVGWHRYTFPKDQPAHVLLDLRPSIYDYPGKVLWASLRVHPDGSVTGCRTTRGWAPGRELCFAMRFSQSMTSRELVNRETDLVYKGFAGPGNRAEDHDAQNGRALEGVFDFGTL